jgi:hypothetical protein
MQIAMHSTQTNLLRNKNKFAPFLNNIKVNYVINKYSKVKIDNNNMKDKTKLCKYLYSFLNQN